MANLDRTIQNSVEAEDDEELEDFEIPSPTDETYRSFYEAYEHFNEVLFAGKLPGCLFTMQRRRRSRGFFACERFGHRRGTEVVDEIALNPATFEERTDREIISTVVHEMVHQWQHHHGKPGRRGYHNKQWAAKMRSLGLIPSHTGEPGGKQTGQSVSHYIQDGGAFDVEWKLLAESGFVVSYQDRLAARPVNPRILKVRYACPVCSIHVWGKPELQLLCIGCSERMR